MNNWIPILALAFSGCAGALLVTIAKLDEQKQQTVDEHANYLAALNLHNAAAEALEQSKTRDCQGHIDFLNFCVETLEKKNDALQDRLSALQKELEQEKAYFEACRNGNKVLQDRLSAILCPNNDHVWRNGVCVKCGRVQDG